MMNIDEAINIVCSALASASCVLTEDNKMVLNGKRWGQSALEAMVAIDKTIAAQAKVIAEKDAEIERLVHYLDIIAFPRRGTPEEDYGVDELGQLAATAIENHRSDK